MGRRKLDWGKKIFLLGLFSLLLFQVTPSFAQEYYGLWSDVRTKWPVFTPKSENAATALSLFGTILPVGTGIMLELDNDQKSNFPFWLAAGGLVIGPSLGYFYGGVERRAWKGIAFRTMVTCGTLFVVALIPDETTIKRSFSLTTREEFSSSDIILLAIGSGVVAISALTDIFSVSGHVKRRNQKLWYGDFAVLPVYFPKHQATGLQLQIVF